MRLRNRRDQFVTIKTEDRLQSNAASHDVDVELADLLAQRVAV
jgi:hypothetical protein